MKRQPPPEITPSIKEKCRAIVMQVAKKHGVPPAYVVAHIRCGQADAARAECMRRMLTQLKLRRWQVAMAFGRDLRRIRKSVLGV